jgi:hypothetical protein
MVALTLVVITPKATPVDVILSDPTHYGTTLGYGEPCRGNS